MPSNPSATILAHPDEMATARELADQLRTLDRNLELELNDALQPWSSTNPESGLVILLATKRLMRELGSQRAEELAVPYLAEKRIIVAVTNVQLGSLLRGADIVDISGFMMAPLPDELRRIVERIHNHWRDQIPLASSEMALTAAMFDKIEQLPLGPRSKSILRNENMIYVGDLIIRTKLEMLNLPGFGRKELQEVEQVLGDLDLGLGVSPNHWPPEDFEGTRAQLLIAYRVEQLKQAEGGARFEPRSDGFKMIVEGEPDDRAAATRTMTRQLQSALLNKARSFDDLAQRLDNQPGWTGIGRTAAALANLVDRPPEAIPDVLGLLYPIALELGSFVEFDRQVASGSASNALPLDAEVRRPLEDLVRTLAPWLRAFPSIRQADDEASRFLMEAAKLEPALAVVDAAALYNVVDQQDTGVFRNLLKAADRGDFQGGKAGLRAKRSATNLVISVVAFTGTFFVGAVSSDYATTSPLVHRAGQFLTHAEKAIGELVTDLAPDLRHAITDLVQELSHQPAAPQ